MYAPAGILVRASTTAALGVIVARADANIALAGIPVPGSEGAAVRFCSCSSAEGVAKTVKVIVIVLTLHSTMSQ